MLTLQQKKEKQQRFLTAVNNAKKVLKSGDRIRVTKCPGRKRWITFSEWDGNWIVSKSGIDDYAASCVDMINGKPIDFCTPENCSIR